MWVWEGGARLDGESLENGTFGLLCWSEWRVAWKYEQANQTGSYQVGGGNLPRAG